MYIPPAPNRHSEKRVRKELQEIDPLLDIKWHSGWHFNERYEELEGRYLLICYWPSNDMRNQELEELRQRGKNYDILGSFTTDPANASSLPQDPESVMSLVLERLASCDGERQPHLERMRQIQEKNAKVREDRKEEVMDEAAENALSVRSKAFEIPTVPVAVNL